VALSSGEHVGPFEILGSLGAGGMGEVYRARDPHLRRDVAIKVLPPAMQHDAVRLARFQREARALAALSHPNIAAIHGLEQHEGINALVLELVDGETLATRIAREPITVSDALAIARQIAAALDAAHEKGIVHRDLKPANVVLTPTGLLKVLDFGLATMAAQEGDVSEQTQTLGRTHEDLVVGTPAYMSPEQARGLMVDKRTDIWAFGCVLYEILTGRRLFDGDSTAETLAFVLTKDPDWSALPLQTPPAVRTLLRRCLERERAKRLGDVAAIRFALEDVSSNAHGTANSAEAERAPTVMSRRTVAGAAAAAAVLIVARAMGLVGGRNSEPTATESPRQIPIALPPGQRLAGLKTGKPMLAMSPSDTHIAYVATTQGEDARQIYLYSIDGTFEPVPGSIGAHTPFFSPDEKWLGFFVQNKLMKIPVKGGLAPQPLAEIVNPSGASWTDDRRIVVASFASVLQIVGQEGGGPKALSRLKPGDTMHRWPSSLPGGKTVLYNVDSDKPTISVQQIGAADRRELLEAQPNRVMPQYSPSGHLVYAQSGNLVAVPFDPVKLQVTDGAPVQVVSGVRHTQGVAHFTMSARGSLAYISGTFQPTTHSLVRISRNGTVERTFGTPRLYNQPRIAPDESRFVVDLFDDDSKLWQLWLYNFQSHELNQFTYRTDRDNRHGTWVGPNRIIVQSDRKGTRQLFLHPTDGGVVMQLTDFPAVEDRIAYIFPISTCGDALTFVRLVPGGEAWMMHLDESSAHGRPDRLDFPMSADGAPSLSPDGRWLAYVSDESGHREVWVRPVSNQGKPQQISRGGGNEPVWHPNRDKRELFYRDGEFMVVAKIDDHGSADGKPERLFPDSYATTLSAYSRPNYDVFRDGSFLMLKTVDQEQPEPQITVVLDWRERLTRRAPGQ
jgi:serine/threonine-protein kinase